VLHVDHAGLDAPVRTSFRRGWNPIDNALTHRQEQLEISARSCQAPFLESQPRSWPVGQGRRRCLYGRPSGLRLGDSDPAGHLRRPPPGTSHLRAGD
jgi:hypothetical protein